MKWIVAASLLFAFQQSWAEGLELQGKIEGGYSQSSMDLTSDRMARFGGYRMGGSGGLVAFVNNYGFGGVIGYRSGTSANSANSSTTTENFDLKSLYLAGKAYAARAYLQLGAALIESNFKLKSGDTTTISQFSGFGIHLSLGFDYIMSKSFYVSPSVFYENASLNQKNSTAGSRRFEEGGLLVGIGIRFN